MRRLPDLEQITAFLAVAEELSFRRAAERLAIDQSALSRRIKDLEYRVECQLFVRTTHAVRLTDAGRSFYDANRKLMASLSEAVDRAKRIAAGMSGSLRIAYMTFAAIDLLPMAARRFAGANPDVALTFCYERTEAQRLSLARGDIDVGLMLGPFEHSDFETLPLSTERLVVMLREDHPLAECGAVSIGDVGAEPLVLGNDQQWDFYRSRIGDMLATHGVTPRIAAEAPSLTGILGLVRAGFGITLVPEVMRSFCPEGLVVRPLSDADSRITTIAAWRKPADGRVQAFVDCLSGVQSKPKQRVAASARRSK